MKIQRSFSDEYLGSGVLYLVGTPIGNLKDITYRAIEILQEVDLIAAEDTRQTIKLLNHYNLNKRLISYHEHNKHSKGKELVGKMKEGLKIALVSDAGMPAISDPGYELVKEAVSESIPVIPIPGANAAVLGLVASGINTNRFSFIGFLPREKKEALKELQAIKNNHWTLIFYEAPHRIKSTLSLISETLGNRDIVLVRELTKKYEEFIRGTVSELIAYLDSNSVKGEITLIIEGAREEDLMEETDWWQELSVKEHVDHYIAKGMDTKGAIKETAIERKQPKRVIYNDYHLI